MSFFDIHFLIFKITTIWKPEFDCTWKNLIYNIYSIIFLITHGSSFVSLILFLFMNNWDVRILSNNIFMLVLIVLITSQFINSKRQKEKIIEVAEIIKLKPHEPENIDEQNIISKYEKINRKQIFLNITSLMCGAIFFHTDKVFGASVPVFPHYIWLPYDLSNPHYYWITLFFVTTSCLISVLIIVQFASFFSSATIIIRSQVAILIYRFKNSMKIIEEKISNADNNDQNIIDEIKKLEKKLIIDFVDNHLEVLELARTINDIFLIDLFMIYFMSTVMICTTAYILSSIPLYSDDFFPTAILCAASIWQITVASYSSNAVSIAFEELYHEITSANLIVLHQETKKSLIIVMMKMLNPFKITIGKIIYPSRESLKYIAQFTYSLFSLLRSF